MNVKLDDIKFNYFYEKFIRKPYLNLLFIIKFIYWIIYNYVDKRPHLIIFSGANTSNEYFLKKIHNQLVNQIKCFKNIKYLFPPSKIVYPNSEPYWWAWPFPTKDDIEFSNETKYSDPNSATFQHLWDVEMIISNNKDLKELFNNINFLNKLNIFLPTNIRPKYVFVGISNGGIPATFFSLLNKSPLVLLSSAPNEDQFEDLKKSNLLVAVTICQNEYYWRGANYLWSRLKNVAPTVKFRWIFNKYHCGENVDDWKYIFEQLKKYEYINYK